MKRTALLLLFASIFLTQSLISGTSAGKTSKRDRKRIRTVDWSPETYAGDIFEPGAKISSAAAVDTYNIVRFDFEPGTWQGWTRRDYSAQRDTFFHIDDFSGLGGGATGKLAAIEGGKSLWCGARPSSEEYMCNWASAPGYGNSWDQRFVSEPFYFAGPIIISFHGFFDSEPEYDHTYIEYSHALGEPWIEVAAFDGRKDTVVTDSLIITQAKTKLRFRFQSDGAWSDKDGLYSSDGAAIIDSITIADAIGTIDFEDFESYPVGAKATDFWHAELPFAFGMYSNIRSGLLDNDPCAENITHQIAFFDATCPPSPDYPGMFVTPFCKTDPLGNDFCQNEGVISPFIDMTRYSTGNDEIQDADIPPGDLDDLGGALLRFTAYADLPYTNLVYYNWMVRNIRDGCPGDWKDRGFATGGPNEDYLFDVNQIGDLVSADTIQVILSVIDMCDAWFDIYGDCAEHTPSPFFDNVAIQRYKTSGPQWYVRAADLFQDNFPSTSDMESWVRADAACDRRAGDDPVIDPGDSVVVTCESPLGGGIAGDATGPRVYMHVRCRYIGDPAAPKADIAGSQLEGTYGHYVSDDGTWTVIQADTARVYGNPSPDKYMFDLNDSLLTRGYMVEYYFKAYDNQGESTTYPADAETAGDYPYRGGSYVYEFTCLPTLGSGGWLFVDDFDGRGSRQGIVQDYWDPTFEAVEQFPPDRYDVLAPTSSLDNGPGSRALQSHLAAYDKIIWDSGDLSFTTISDGTAASDKSNDCQMLIDWMEGSAHNTSLLVMGDNVASDLFYMGGTASNLMNNFCGTAFVDYSYFYATGGFDEGGIENPQVTLVGDPAFSYCLYGGCSRNNSFDILDKTGPGEYWCAYPAAGETEYYAGIAAEQLSPASDTIRTLFIGHSMMRMRDCNGDGMLIRNNFFAAVSDYMKGNVKGDITGDDIPAATALTGNYPNPFNPATTIEFSLAGRTRVAISIYDVSGRLVRALVDGEREAGSYREVWDGKSGAGLEAASGVYFCRMTAGGYEKNIKMVLLR